MKLTLDGIKNANEWESKGIKLPKYNVKEVKEETAKNSFLFYIIHL